MRVVMVRLTCPFAYFGEGEVDAEGELWILQVRFELVNDFSKLVWCIAKSADAA